jgi:myo-inositol-1(or 4)-monophosphatase
MSHKTQQEANHLKNWLTLLKTCSRKIRKEVMPFFKSPEANFGFGIGAGGDIMKRIDLIAEKTLIETIEKEGFSCTLISEETGVREIGDDPADFYVTTDPIDGTTNATRGIPFMATSLAVSKKPYLNQIETALITDLYHNVTYTAKRDKGAYRNGARMRPSELQSLNEAIIGIDFTHKAWEIASRLRFMLEKTKHLRHLGANSLELCYVADGTTDGFIDIRGKLRTTDVAAAYLILKEAGGTITTLEGKELNAELAPLQRVSFIATGNKRLHEIIMEQIK